MTRPAPEDALTRLNPRRRPRCGGRRGPPRGAPARAVAGSGVLERTQRQHRSWAMAKAPRRSAQGATPNPADLPPSLPTYLPHPFNMSPLHSSAKGTG
jgi:hypothetical protein